MSKQAVEDGAVTDHYGGQFARTLRSFGSFAVAFSFISITTGIFSTFGFALTTGGPAAIWTWWIVVVGQLLVAAIYAALSAKVPLSGYSYQWATRLSNVHVGWWMGWTSFAFLSIVTASVDYGFVTTAFQPLVGMTTTPLSAAVLTLVVLAVQALLIVGSTVATTKLNNAAVGTEILGILGLTVALFIVAAVRHQGHWTNVFSTGTVGSHHYFSYLGPFMLATLLGAYTIVGFEAACNLAEETHEPRKVVPTAVLRAVLLAGIIGFAFCLSLSYAIRNIPAATKSSAPVSFIIQNVLGGPVEKVFLVFVCTSIFACGLVIMVTNGRLIWSMARDRRLPGHQLWSRVPRATGGPIWATILAAAVSAVIILALRNNGNALTTLFTASSIMPALLYSGTVILYALTRKKLASDNRYFQLGRFEVPVILGALIWLAYELVLLIGPHQFRTAQYYVLGSLAVGAVVYAGQRLIEPSAMTRGDLPSVDKVLADNPSAPR